MDTGEGITYSIWCIFGVFFFKKCPDNQNYPLHQNKRGLPIFMESPRAYVLIKNFSEKIYNYRFISTNFLVAVKSLVSKV